MTKELIAINSISFKEAHIIKRSSIDEDTKYVKAVGIAAIQLV